jgi:hypothetical protein
MSQRWGSSICLVRVLAGRRTTALLVELSRSDLRYQELHDRLDRISYKVLTGCSPNRPSCRFSIRPTAPTMTRHSAQINSYSVVCIGPSAYPQERRSIGYGRRPRVDFTYSRTHNRQTD